MHIPGSWYAAEDQWEDAQIATVDEVMEIVGADDGGGYATFGELAEAFTEAYHGPG